MDLAIVGLERAGKSTLFNALTGGDARVGAHARDDRPTVGVVHVPDARLDAVATVLKPARTTYAEIRWLDFPAAGFGPSGPATPFLAELASMDALVHVVRAFADEAVSHPVGSVDPDRDIESLDLELTVADLALLERRLRRLDLEMRSLPAGQRAGLERERSLLATLAEALEAGTALRALALGEDRAHVLAQYQFVTRRPLLLVVNVAEDDAARASEIERAFAERYDASGVAVVALCAKLEAELAELEPDEAREFRAELGLGEQSPLDRAVRAAYALLGVQSFLTVEGDECRAWTLPRGATAAEAAGKIHSDMERGFIRAEVARWDELVEAGSFAELRRHGKLHTEGKAYEVQDGDVLHILFNV